LVKAPVLAHPDPARPFVVTTDASKVGLGGELSQDAQRQLYPVAYFSRALTKRERSYPTYDREVTAHPRSQCLTSAHPLPRRDPGMVWSRES
jgi:hypothetical protein